ncbi:hypothetical protein QBC35DRAFT_555187 [Podospora australis]|uniref:DUF676 domain-containing protein n=1 Tax=Podospora australis TaxID=1536484 RepID=A0AAN6WT86_9PEZI|nr:hypothetical protein QBC35DRAFT_555187 [Podospora australis]
MSRRVFLEELFVPDENKHGPINIDLVLIHGVDGDSVQTWKDVDSGMIWPVDLIPQCQPRTRVLSFAYNGDMYRNDCAASIRDNARSLLSFLMTKRKRVGPERRIVFVAHCLGGLIAKHALYVSEFEKEFRAIKAATDGVLFFGTPHQGTHRDEWDRIGKAFSPLDKVTRGRRSPLVDAMKRSSHALADINDKFRQIAVNYDITSFYETGLWPGTSKLIVDKTAGVMMIPHEKRVHIDAHHRAMCTFSSVKDPIFETMCDRILQATEVEEESETEEASEANDAGVPGTMAAFTYPASTAAPGRSDHLGLGTHWHLAP